PSSAPPAGGQHSWLPQGRYDHQRPPATYSALSSSTSSRPAAVPISPTTSRSGSSAGSGTPEPGGSDRDGTQPDGADPAGGAAPYPSTSSRRPPAHATRAAR